MVRLVVATLLSILVSPSSGLELHHSHPQGKSKHAKAFKQNQDPDVQAKIKSDMSKRTMEKRIKAAAQLKESTLEFLMQFTQEDVNKVKANMKGSEGSKQSLLQTPVSFVELSEPTPVDGMMAAIEYNRNLAMEAEKKAKMADYHRAAPPALISEKDAKSLNFTVESTPEAKQLEDSTLGDLKKYVENPEYQKEHEAAIQKLAQKGAVPMPQGVKALTDLMKKAFMDHVNLLQPKAFKSPNANGLLGSLLQKDSTGAEAVTMGGLTMQEVWKVLKDPEVRAQAKKEQKALNAKRVKAKAELENDAKVQIKEAVQALEKEEKLQIKVAVGNETVQAAVSQAEEFEKHTALQKGEQEEWAKKARMKKIQDDREGKKELKNLHILTKASPKFKTAVKQWEMVTNEVTKLLLQDPQDENAITMKAKRLEDQYAQVAAAVAEGKDAEVMAALVRITSTTAQNAAKLVDQRSTGEQFTLGDCAKIGPYEQKCQCVTKRVGEFAHQSHTVPQQEHLRWLVGKVSGCQPASKEEYTTV